MLNPVDIIKAKNTIESLHRNHRDAFSFFNKTIKEVDEGTEITISVKTSNGKILKEKIQLSKKDIEDIKELNRIKEILN